MLCINILTTKIEEGHGKRIRGNNRVISGEIGRSSAGAVMSREDLAGTVPSRAINWLVITRAIREARPSGQISSLRLTGCAQKAISQPAMFSADNRSHSSLSLSLS